MLLGEGLGCALQPGSLVEVVADPPLPELDFELGVVLLDARLVHLAAFLVGMLRVMSVAYLDSSFRDAFVFALLIAVLLVRPSGLFGRGRAVRA